MTIDDLKIQQIRSEGFAEGFKTGYAAALSYIAGEMEKEKYKEVPANAGI